MGAQSTLLDEKIYETVTMLKDIYRVKRYAHAYPVSSQEILSTYKEVHQEISKWAGYIERITDSLEFCLSEVWPPSQDALYYVNVTVSR